MGVTVDKVIETYTYYNYDVMDPRSRDIFYLNAPWFWITIVTLYVYFVQNLGPKLMKDRPAFQLDGVIRIYNLIQIVANLYIFIKGSYLTMDTRFNWRCMPILYDVGEFSTEIRQLSFIYFWLKYLDLFDTVFFVLRKKFSQITFLHVYHHAMMVFGLWMALKYFPGGNPLILALLNTFVHVVMYGYYLLSSIYSEYKKSLWWKKYLTQLQIAQFFFSGVHVSQVLFHNPCGYPYWAAMALVVQVNFMAILFFDFYRKAYMIKKSV